MTTPSTSPEFNYGRDWRTAFSALQRLLADANDTPQVFRIMGALNAGTAKRGYDRLLQTSEGGRIAYHRVDLASHLSDRELIDLCPAGSVGAAYAAFIDETGYSATSLADASSACGGQRDAEHPYTWFARRTRDIHDLWHILTGYPADDPLGEACLAAFSYAQTGGLGWAFIAVGSALKASLSHKDVRPARSIWEGYRRGRQAA